MSGMNTLKPCIKDQNMVRIIQELGLNVAISLSDLQKPTSQFVSKIYMNFLTYLDLEIEVGSDFSEFQCLMYPDFHRGIMQIGQLASNLNFFFKKIECPVEFVISDLLFPTSLRTRFFMAENLNFLLYAKENNSKICNARELRNNSAARLEQLQTTKHSLEEKYFSSASEKSEREAKVKNFDLRMLEAEKKRNTCNEEIVQQQTLLSELKGEMVELQDRVETRQRSRDDKQAIIRQLETQLVLSPDRIRGELHHLEEALSISIDQEKEKEATLQTRKNLLHRIESYSSSVIDTKKKAKETAALLQTKRTITAEANKKLDTRKKLVTCIDNVDASLYKENIKIKEATGKLNSLNLSCQEKQRQMSENHLSLLREREKLEELLDATDQRIQELREEEEDLEQDKYKLTEYKNQAESTLPLVDEAIALKFDEKVLETFNTLLGSEITSPL